MGNQNGGMAKDDLEGRDVRQLDKNVSAALARGVRYNMKILVRGQVVWRQVGHARRVSWTLWVRSQCCGRTVSQRRAYAVL